MIDAGQAAKGSHSGTWHFDDFGLCILPASRLALLPAQLAVPRGRKGDAPALQVGPNSNHESTTIRNQCGLAESSDGQ